MKIDEREIEMLSTELNSKEYTGLFYGPGNNISDLKSCLLRHLDDCEKNGPEQDPFPLRLSNFIEGNPQSDRFTFCQFTIDYDLKGGLHITGITAYQQKTKEGHLRHANADLKAVAIIPTKKEVLGLEYKALDSPVTPSYVNEFVRLLAEKGYEGHFFAGNQGPSDPETFLLRQLESQGRHNQFSHAFAFWMGTITEGKTGDKELKTCWMKVQFDYLDGFKIDHIKYSQRQLKNNKISLEKEQKIPSMIHLPTRAQINASLDASFKKVKRKRRGI